jgi:hypothetical protein
LAVITNENGAPPKIMTRLTLAVRTAVTASLAERVLSMLPWFKASGITDPIMPEFPRTDAKPAAKIPIAKIHFAASPTAGSRMAMKSVLSSTERPGITAAAAMTMRTEINAGIPTPGSVSTRVVALYSARLVPFSRMVYTA